jgi:hypothetical protein
VVWFIYYLLWFLVKHHSVFDTSTSRPCYAPIQKSFHRGPLWRKKNSAFNFFSMSRSSLRYHCCKILVTTPAECLLSLFSTSADSSLL